jgi:hypothetical protein
MQSSTDSAYRLSSSLSLSHTEHPCACLFVCACACGWVGPQQREEEYLKYEATQRAAFDLFLAKRGQTLEALTRSDDIKLLIRGGVPHDYRAHVRTQWVYKRERSTAAAHTERAVCCPCACMRTGALPSPSLCVYLSACRRSGRRQRPRAYYVCMHACVCTCMHERLYVYMDVSIVA